LFYTSVDDMVFIKFKVKLYYNIDIQKRGRDANGKIARELRTLTECYFTN
jgi:hypothetical protein